MFSGERRSFHPESRSYVEAYIQFYARRVGQEAEGAVGDNEPIAISAKTHLIDHLYKYLDTLDSKCSALLAFCGLTLTAISLMIAFYESKAPKYDFILQLIFVAVSIPSVIALTVINVHWSSAEDLRTLDEACRSYYTTMRSRTQRFILARGLVLGAVVCLSGYVLIDLLCTLHAKAF